MMTRCCLHDRTSDDFSVGKEEGARHTVKMLEGIDSCMSLPSEKFVSLQSRIMNMMRKHSLHARSTLTTSGKLFYMYDGPAFKWRDLITCYRNENGKRERDESEREMSLLRVCVCREMGGGQCMSQELSQVVELIVLNYMNI
jgi:hypothetical protein